MTQTKHEFRKLNLNSAKLQASSFKLHEEGTAALVTMLIISSIVLLLALSNATRSGIEVLSSAQESRTEEALYGAQAGLDEGYLWLARHRDDANCYLYTARTGETFCPSNAGSAPLVVGNAQVEVQLSAESANVRKVTARSAVRTTARVLEASVVIDQFGKVTVQSVREL